MKNGSLDQFLDTRWYMGAELYYHHYIYWCEGVTDLDTKVTTFTVERWRAECDGELYHQYVDQQGHLIDHETVFCITGTDIDELKRQFLSALIFDGRSFWDVENEIVWAEMGNDITESDNNG